MDHHIETAVTAPIEFDGTPSDSHALISTTLNSDLLQGGMAVPEFRSTTYASEVDKQLGQTYGRYSLSPTHRFVQKKFTELEKGADAALMFASGMAAISTSLQAILLADADVEEDQPREIHALFSNKIYGGTRGFVKKILEKENGIRVEWFDASDPQELKGSLRPTTKLVFFEILSNPLVEVADCEEIFRIIEEHEAECQSRMTVVVDNTFATPLGCNPLSVDFNTPRCADLVIHSVSKYLGGHSDILGGIAAGKKKVMDLIWRRSLLFGGVMDPHTVALVDRSLKTLAIRFRAQSENANRLARHFATKEQWISKVHHPGLESHPHHALATRLLPGGMFGGVLAVNFRGGIDAALEFARGTTVMKYVPSLGGLETVMSLPVLTSHASLSNAEREKLGIEPGTLRISVGIEHLEDLLADCDSALSRL